MSYYSQFGEDKIIESFFSEGYVGGCIDIGASDGVSINNTKHFEELGWHCLCIEPNPNYFKYLVGNRANCLKCAVSSNEGYTDFNIINLNGTIEDAISSLEIDKRLLKQFEGSYSINPYTIQVRTLTLDSCIQQAYKHDKIDFISIDVEGTELDVLKSFSIEKWNPKLFVIENNFNDPDVEFYLNLFGYKKIKRIEINDFYIK